MKDKEWLKEEVDRYLSYEGVNEARNALVFAKGVINQLEEPEKLSEEWINEHSKCYTMENSVEISDLKNLLLPQPKKPVIPQFVADWYESEGKRSSWWNWFYKWGRGEHRTDLETKTIRWMQDFNEELFVDMFRFGYEVEEEQKYQVIIRDGEYIRLYLCKHGDNVIIGTNDNYIEKCPEVTYLTEQEIKDYDERYWEFAQEATE